MSNFSPLNLIITGKDGQLDGMTMAEIDAIVAKIGQTGKSVWHFHGGLVPRKDGIESATRLYNACYNATGAHSVFLCGKAGCLRLSPTIGGRFSTKH